MVRCSVSRNLIVAATLTAALHGTQAEGQATERTGGCATRRIGRIIVETDDVIARDSTDPMLARRATALVNGVHIRTKPSFVRSELLFREGDCLDSLRLAESQRLLTSYSFLRWAKITVEGDERTDAVVRVVTRDEWSTKLDMGIVYDAGARLEDVQATEGNVLGYGVRAQLKRSERRAKLDEYYSLGTPRFFGRADASAYYGHSRAGNFYGAGVAYPFVGTVGRNSLSESFFRRVDFVTYVGGENQAYSHVQIPTERQYVELAAARRLGRLGKAATVLGITLSHERWRVSGEPTFVTNSNFGDGTSAPGTLPAPIAAQLKDGALTLIGLHLGTQRFRYVEMVGLDAIREVQNVDLGYNAGFTLGQGLAVGAPRGVPPLTDTYGRVHTSFGTMLGASFVHGSLTTQAGYSAAGWRDIQTGADLVGYGRANWLPNQTVFLRISGAGGWSMQSPHQLTLGGRDGVRSLVDDAFPGAQRTVVFLEDRVRLDWPDWSAIDLGMTLFADAGRMWAGDAPFGQASPWLASVGAGLRLGVSRGTHSIIRPDIVWPLGRGGTPMIRVVYEVNVYGDRFWTPKLGASVPRLRGWERF